MSGKNITHMPPKVIVMYKASSRLAPPFAATDSTSSPTSPPITAPTSSTASPVLKPSIPPSPAAPSASVSSTTAISPLFLPDQAPSVPPISPEPKVMKDVPGASTDKTGASSSSTASTASAASTSSAAATSSTSSCSIRMLYLAPKHSRLRTGAMEYAAMEFSSENLKFLLNLYDIEQMLNEELKRRVDKLMDIEENPADQEKQKIKITESPEYQILLNDLYQKFIPKEALRSINISDEKRKALNEKVLSKQPLTLEDFQLARAEIELVVDTDTLKRFEASGHYKKVIEWNKRELEILQTLKSNLQSYLKSNIKHKTSKGCCFCSGPDRTAIYFNLEQLTSKLPEIKPGMINPATVQDIIALYWTYHLEILGPKHKHDFTPHFETTLTELRAIAPKVPIATPRR